MQMRKLPGPCKSGSLQISTKACTYFQKGTVIFSGNFLKWKRTNTIIQQDYCTSSGRKGTTSFLILDFQPSGCSIKKISSSLLESSLFIFLPLIDFITSLKDTFCYSKLFIVKFTPFTVCWPQPVTRHPASHLFSCPVQWDRRKNRKSKGEKKLWVQLKTV